LLNRKISMEKLTTSGKNAEKLKPKTISAAAQTLINTDLF